MAFSFAEYNNEREFIQAEEEFTILPDGVYQLMLESAEWKNTNRGDGKYLALKWVVLAPEEFNGAIVFDNLNLDNPHEKAVVVAKRRLKSIEDYSGREFFSEDDMPGSVVNAKIVQEEFKGRDGSDKLSNKIKSYRENDSGAVQIEEEPSTPAPAPRPTAPTPRPNPAPSNGKAQPANAGAGSESKPWKR
ncbi:MAG: DUF669 domain-containing protein [Bacteroidales bacterium]|nr:DUF669 domain-containing protein [Bacteroidales bacterium]